MSTTELANLQAVLARVFTDRAVREACFADRQRVAADFGLNESEAAMLSQLSQPHVAFHARALCRKRLAAVEKLLPLTHRLLGPRFVELFLAYAERTPLPAGHRYRRDAVQFAEFLANDAVQTDMPEACCEALRFENACLRAVGGRLLPRFGLYRLPAPWGNPQSRSVGSADFIPTVRILAFWWRPPFLARGWEFCIPLGDS